MTPAEEYDLLISTSATIDEDAQEATDELVALILAGEAPAQATQTVMDQFSLDMGDALAFALIGILGAQMSGDDALQIRVGAVPLSQRLGSIATELAGTVKNIVERQVLGFAEARAVALKLFTDYATREPGADVLKIVRENRGLPQYLREALLTDPGIEGAMQRQMARLQVDGLSNAALREAYSGVLSALDDMEAGQGKALLEKRIRTAFYARLRYFAQRIAQTELHRRFMEQAALDLMKDPNALYVQVRRAPGREGIPCICSLYTGRNLYGMGPGVYPRAVAPLPPFHPYCRCLIVSRPLLANAAAPEPDPDADRYFLRSLGLRTGAQVMGSRAKLEQVLNGTRSAEDVASLGRRVPLQTVGQIRP